jgi:simple sugar transport system permease protein
MTSLLVTAIADATPLILVALGGVIAERAGVMSIGLEGYMLAGAFAAVATSNSHGAWLGLGAAMCAGLVVALLHGFLSVSARVNQIISGLALNLFALGATGFLNSIIFGQGRAGKQVPAFSSLPLPGLASIPGLGKVVFDQTLFTYLAAVVLVLVVVYFRRTRSGLSLHAVGEHPAAAEARGLSVPRIRYLAVAVSGLLAGLGGAALSIAQVDSFVDNMTAGRGYIALAAVVFAGWRPLGAVAACLLFGLAEAGQVWANVLNVHLPFEVLAMTPYVVTIVALVGLGRRGRAPSALGIAYRSGQR